MNNLIGFLLSLDFVSLCSIIKCINRQTYIPMHISINVVCMRASQVVQWSRIHPTMQETQEMRVLSLGREDPLEEEIATHSSILAWKMPWTEGPGRLQSMGSQRVGSD